MLVNALPVTLLSGHLGSVTGGCARRVVRTEYGQKGWRIILENKLMLIVLDHFITQSNISNCSICPVKALSWGMTVEMLCCMLLFAKETNYTSFQKQKMYSILSPLFKELHCEPKLSDLQWLTFIRCSLGGSLRGNGSEELWSGVCNT